VIRTGGSDGEYRGYAGQLASGALRAGEEVVVLPGGHRTRIAAIDTYEGELEEIVAPLSATLRLEDDLDVSRGDLVAGAAEPPIVAREFEADVCWLDSEPLQARRRYAIKHTSREARRGRDRPHRRAHARAHTGAGHARAQRHRAHRAAHERAARDRHVSVEPPHWQLHPDRRGHERHRGCRDD
jgi:sulfate adenylyltransferase subunit 1 (EFTu-like GTPase family)